MDLNVLLLRLEALELRLKLLEKEKIELKDRFSRYESPKNSNNSSKPPNKKRKELYTFYKRMRREQQNLFVFLYTLEVPADNNASERAIRNIKVKQKISGQFKTTTAAQNFAKIRSVVDTTIKNGMNVLIRFITKNFAYSSFLFPFYFV